jgi:Group II intron, maturase-specific domain
MASSCWCGPGRLSGAIARRIHRCAIKCDRLHAAAARHRGDFDFLGFHIQWKRKRGTNQWYVYTFIAHIPVRIVKAKVRSLTHRVSQANMGTVITRIDQILRGRTNHLGRAVCKHTLNQLRYFLNWRLIRWLRKRHRWRWRQFRRRFTTPSGACLPFGADGVILINPAAGAVSRYRYRGERSPPLPAKDTSEQLSVESRVHREAHVRFGERPGETDRQ